MPVYKVKILNKEINLNYEDVHKERLIEAINQIKNKIKSIDNLNGKISDTQLLTFLSIKLQDEIFELEQKKIDLNFTNEFTDLKNKNLNLNNEIFQLKEKNKSLETENNSIQESLDQLTKQINILLSLIKSNYED
tara:strand:- start:412 stop:816 length:405 start_codon:yes stop_codon:yes gene_type:complete